MNLKNDTQPAPLRTMSMKHLAARPKSKEPAPLLIVFMKHHVARPKSKELAPLRTVLMTLGCPE